MKYFYSICAYLGFLGSLLAGARARPGRGQGEARARPGRGQGEARARPGRGQGEAKICLHCQNVGQGQAKARPRLVV
jgi:hypothetical protein